MRSHPRRQCVLDRTDLCPAAAFRSGVGVMPAAYSRYGADNDASAPLSGGAAEFAAEVAHLDRGQRELGARSGGADQRVDGLVRELASISPSPERRGRLVGVHVYVQELRAW